MPKLYEYILRARDESSETFKKIKVAAGYASSGVQELDRKLNKAAGVSKATGGILGNLTKEVQRLEAAKMRAWNTAQIDSFNKKIEETKNKIKSLNSVSQPLLPKSNIDKSTGGAGLALGAVGKFGGMAAAVAGVVALGKEVISVGSNMEQVRIAFETFIGDAALAKAKIVELQKFADVSPFNTMEVFDAGQTLLGFGVEANKLLPIMQRLGDASKGNAVKFSSLVDNYGKMVAAQRANTMDLNQFAIAGVPVWEELSKLTGKSGKELRKWVEENGVGLETIDKIFTNLTTKGGKFFGMMDKQSQSTAGLWSTFMSKIEAGYVKVFERIQPFINSLIKAGLDLVAWFEKIDFSKLFESYGEGFSAFLGTLDTAWRTIKQIFSLFKSDSNPLKLILDGLGLYVKVWSKIIDGILYGVNQVVGLIAGVQGVLDNKAANRAAGRTGFLEQFKDSGLAFNAARERSLKMLDKRRVSGEDKESAVAEFLNGKSSSKSTVGSEAKTKTTDGIEAITSGGSKNINVNVHVAKFQDKTEIHSNTVGESVAQMEDRLREAFARILNGALYVGTQ